MNREDLLSKVQEFYRQYNYAADMIDVYHNSDAAEDEMKKAGKSSEVYFHLVCSACVDSFLMTLARMYDEHKDSENIPALINECKANSELFDHPKEVMEYLTDAGRTQRRDTVLRQTQEIIKARRNAYLAHNDKAHFGGKVPPTVNGQKDKATGYLGMYSVWELSRYTGALLRYLLSELSYDPDKMERLYHNEISDLFPALTIDFNAPV